MRSLYHLACGVSFALRLRNSRINDSRLEGLQERRVAIGSQRGAQQNASFWPRSK
jgi:hypothetical protein